MYQKKIQTFVKEFKWIIRLPEMFLNRDSFIRIVRFICLPEDT
jgi:hypothetical protein